jgi:LemA protein
MPVALWVILGIVLVVGIWVLLTFNRLVGLRNYCREAWADIDTELKRRHDLIPNLVETVKGYAAHEKGVFEEVTRLRQACMSAGNGPALQSAPENELVRALGKLLAVAESYPELKASENFLKLQQELVNTEDRLQAARRFFNGNVRELNNLVQTVPSNLIAGMFGFTPEEFFEVENSAERDAVKVSI